MKIAMIQTPLVGRGGGQRQILRLATELQKLGHHVEIFTNAVDPEECYPDLLKNLKVNVIPHPLGRKMPRWLTPIETYRKTAGSDNEETSALRNWMRKNMGRQFYTIPYELLAMLNIGRKIPKGFDIINNHNYPTEWAAFYAKRKLKIPIVWMCNEPPFWFYVPEIRKGLRKINWPVYEIFDRIATDCIDEIVVLSYIAGGYVRQVYGRAARVVRSGTDLDLYRSASGTRVRERLNLKDDFVLLQTGNLELNKRQADTIIALSYLARKYNNVKLILDGGGRREELIALSQRLGVEDKLITQLTLNDRELAEVYAACDVFLFPAQITWGLAVIEAMAASKPTIVSRKCGASEIIEDGINGLLVDHARPDQIAKKAEALMNDSQLRRKIGENAHEYVNSHLSWENYTKSMETVFERAISSFRER
jgi:glycosyltransferase involved in cell wall biosynthesis